MKPLEENTGETLQDSGIDRDFFLDKTPKKHRKQKQNRQMRLHQTKKFCIAKEAINRVKR